MIKPEELPIDCKFYLKPEGFIPSGSACHAARRLASGWMAFTALRVIVRVEGRRVLEKLVPTDDFEAYLHHFLMPHREKLLVLLNALVSARPAMEWDGLSLMWDRPRVMGILNVTPDSFSDGGLFSSTNMAMTYARDMIAAGVDIIDVGGESTRPGAESVSTEDELARVLPVIDALSGEGCVLSIDTRQAAVMAEAVAHGAHMINDVNALEGDGAVDEAAKSGRPVVLMHAQGDPRTMQDAPAYGDVLLDVYDYLEARIAACVAAGVAREAIIVDPGIGFGKTVGHNAALIEGLSIFHALGCPVMLGASRKSFIAKMSADEASDQRIGGSLAAMMMGVQQGVQLYRVHDVAMSVQAAQVFVDVVKSADNNN